MGQAHRAEEAAYLLDTEDRREGAALPRAHEVEDGPGALQGVDIEELDGGEGGGEGAFRG